MIRRFLAGAVGLATTANGALMLADGARWFGSVPGVAETGPFNPHLVADVGIAFLVAGLALLARAWRPALWPAGLAGAGVLVGHAALHAGAIATGASQHALFETATVLIPALLALWSTWPDGRTRPAPEDGRQAHV